jgi:hypothetical protein
LLPEINLDALKSDKKWLISVHYNPRKIVKIIKIIKAIKATHTYPPSPLDGMIQISSNRISHVCVVLKMLEAMSFVENRCPWSE